MPILLTFRHVSEGGVNKEASQETRLSVIRTACEAGLVEMVDVEKANEPEFLEDVYKRQSLDAALRGGNHFSESGGLRRGDGVKFRKAAESVSCLLYTSRCV